MKKIILSAAVAAMAFSTAAVAEEAKGIDMVVTGQAVVYYETNDIGTNTDMFSQAASKANVGLQVNANADLKNGFTFGTQLSYLGTAGLEKNLVSGVKQSAAMSLATTTTQQLALSKIFVAKTVGNTTVKLGRQELPKSLSPLAFSEGWNVFKNTFDAVVAINTDLPDTTLVGAYVSGGTGMDLESTGNLTASTGAGSATVAGTAYMLTAANKSLPMTAITASYYKLSKIGANLVAGSDIGADAVWLDAQVADKSLPMGLSIGLQAGSIMPDEKLGAVTMDDTTAFGVKVAAKPLPALTVAAMYTSVDGTDDKVNVAIKNTGTGIKTPLYTQMVANQDMIALDANTFGLSAAYSLGDMGTIIARGTTTSAGKSNLKGSEVDSTDMELIYKLNAGGVSYLAALVNVDTDDNTENDGNIVRVWARYNF